MQHTKSERLSTQMIDYLEIALGGTIDQETRDYINKSHSASKSLDIAINNLLDIMKVEGGHDLTKNASF